uniref:Uncharacterized protein n=1 Tax=Anguilla anguilla TaxID=7936 RepID=A0A0E9SZ24_ANGAN
MWSRHFDFGVRGEISRCLLCMEGSIVNWTGRDVEGANPGARGRYLIVVIQCF